MTRHKLQAALDAARAAPKLERMFSVRLTADEYERLARAAEREGVAMAMLARILIAEGLAGLAGR